ncbi:MAG: DMT family transporter, partial [Anaerolineales bacterium]|nr:DMT family transporter [Anaerolineales bacterium]
MERTLNTNQSRLSGIFLVIIAAACWGTSGIFIINIINKGGLSAIGLAFWRDLLSSLILLVGILIINPKLLRIKKEDLPTLIGMGTISIGAFHIFWNIAVIHLGPSLATVIQCNAPVFVTIMARLIYKERLSFRKILAIGAAAAGTVLAAGLINGQDLNIDPKAIWIALGSAITYSSLSLFG